MTRVSDVAFRCAPVGDGKRRHRVVVSNIYGGGACAAESRAARRVRERDMESFVCLVKRVLNGGNVEACELLTVVEGECAEGGGVVLSGNGRPVDCLVVNCDRALRAANAPKRYGVAAAFRMRVVHRVELNHSEDVVARDCADALRVAKRPVTRA